jgi:hypothetical protein
MVDGDDTHQLISHAIQLAPLLINNDNVKRKLAVLVSVSYPIMSL